MKTTIHYATCCSVCNEIAYGFSQLTIDVNNPGLECLVPDCDGMCYIIYQTNDEHEAQAKNEALADYNRLVKFGN